MGRGCRDSYMRGAGVGSAVLGSLAPQPFYDLDKKRVVNCEKLPRGITLLSGPYSAVKKKGGQGRSQRSKKKGGGIQRWDFQSGRQRTAWAPAN